MRSPVLNHGSRCQSVLRFCGCSSCATGGDLGNRPRGKMSQAFEDAIFALPIDGLSGVVDTEVGLHLILRLPLEPRR